MVVGHRRGLRAQETAEILWNGEERRREREGTEKGQRRDREGTERKGEEVWTPHTRHSIELVAVRFTVNYKSIHLSCVCTGKYIEYDYMIYIN